MASAKREQGHATQKAKKGTGGGLLWVLGKFVNSLPDRVLPLL
jgi:hypothetical protein